MRRVAILIAGLAVVVSGCATAKSRPPRAAAPAEVDVTGRWIGTWYGHGIVGIPREQDAFADFVQRGSGGRGVLTLDGAPAAEGVPAASRMAGLSGSRVFLEVAGSDLVLVHELGPRHLKARFRVDGDRMVGHISDAQPPVRIVLERQKPEPPKPAAAPTRPEPQVAAPPPPPPSAVEPAPTPPPPAVAMTPAPGSEAAEAKPEGAPRPAPDEFAEAPQLKAVHFDFDKSAIRPEDVAVLDESAEWLKGNEVLVLIEGHADERGTNEYNLALGERRAKAVREHLVNKGVAAERINTVSYGEERPACTDKNETCWKQNRRARTLIKGQ